MDSFLKNFSLSHILRQMMCGVVFFVPLYFWNENFQTFLGSDFATNKLIILAILSIIIGTIIYHLEKNILGYLQQALDCLINHFGQNCIIEKNITTFFSILLIIIGLEAVAWIAVIPSQLPLIITFIVVSLSLAFAYSYTKSMDLTIATWSLSSLNRINATELNQNNLNILQIQEIMKRESGWADFIHAAQSCAIAWLLGSCLSSNSTPTSSTFPIDKETSINIAILLILIETLFYSHKQSYIHFLQSKFILNDSIDINKLKTTSLSSDPKKPDAS